jgi:hypothetical protein
MQIFWTSPFGVTFGAANFKLRTRSISIDIRWLAAPWQRTLGQADTRMCRRNLEFATDAARDSKDQQTEGVIC